MEFLSGKTLRHFITDTGPPPGPEQIRAIASDIAAPLSATHGAGIVHGDIKPENVMVSSLGAAKVLDFGLARDTRRDFVTNASTHGVMAGTWRFMSPERCRGEAASAASDMFAFGLVLYKLYAGAHPWQDNSTVQKMHRILTEPTPVPAHWRVAPPAPLQRLNCHGAVFLTSHFVNRSDVGMG